MTCIKHILYKKVNKAKHKLQIWRIVARTHPNQNSSTHTWTNRWRAELKRLQTSKRLMYPTKGMTKAAPMSSNIFNIYQRTQNASSMASTEQSSLCISHRKEVENQRRRSRNMEDLKRRSWEGMGPELHRNLMRAWKWQVNTPLVSQTIFWARSLKIKIRNKTMLARTFTEPKDSNVEKIIFTASSAQNFVILILLSSKQKLSNSWFSKSPRKRDKLSLKRKSHCKQASYQKLQCLMSWSNFFMKTKNFISYYKILYKYAILQQKSQDFTKINQFQYPHRTIIKK